MTPLEKMINAQRELTEAQNTARHTDSEDRAERAGFDLKVEECKVKMTEAIAAFTSSL